MDMRKHRQRFWLAIVVGLTMVLAIGVVQLAGAAVSAVTPTDPCPPSRTPLSSQPLFLQEKCAMLRQLASRELTAQARPYTTSAMTPVNPAISGTPVPPGYIPDRDKVSKPLTPSASFQGLSQHPQPITSAWQIGAIPDPNDPSNYGVLRVFAIGPPGFTGNAWIGLELLTDGPMAASVTRQYNRFWDCPRSVGTITITNVTGPNDVITFTTSSEVNGTLDMSTGTWTFSS
jgi:hypothetical protein